jgi:alpha-tubulin suppressor-like RCC1 family protein
MRDLAPHSSTVRFATLLTLLLACAPERAAAPPVLAPPKTPFLAPAAIGSVALSTEDLCVRLTNGGVLCRKDYRPPAERGEPASFVPIFPSGDIVQVALGGSHGCVRRSTGVVQCWGDNEGGEVSGDEMMVPYPRIVPINGAASQVALGAKRSCAVLIDGHLVCWGTFAGVRRPPGIVPGLPDVAEAALNDNNLCVRTRDHQVRCARGDGPLVPVVGMGKAAQIVVGREHACARLTDDTVSCWSVRKEDMLKSSLPGVAVNGLTQITQISSGDAHVCALHSDGRVFCWGSNEYGELGDGTRNGRANPLPISSLESIQQLVSGGRRSCARRTDGAVLCWGRNLLDDAMFHALTGKQSPPGPPGEDDSLIPEPLRVPGTLHASG